MWRGIRSVGVALSAVALAPALGCGGGGSGGGVQPSTLDQFYAQLVAIICHKTFTCCDATELATLDPTITDEASCRTYYGGRTSQNSTRLQTQIDAGLTVYDSAAAGRCLAEITALTCAQWAGDLSLLRYPDCSHVIAGTAAPGTVCTASDQCAGNYCGSTSTAMGPVCTAPANRGESCEFAACVPGLSCLSNSSGGPRTCSDPLPDGSACIVGKDCASTFCLTDSTPGDMTCGMPTTCNGI